MTSKILNKNFSINLLIVLAIFLLDRLTKIYVIYLNKRYLGSEIFSSEFLNITLIWNEGIAFGLLSFDKNYLYNILTLLIFIVIVIIYFMLLKSNGFQRYSLLMILGGAVGNFFDRVFAKAVPDFIDFHIGNFHWFIFNFADVFITIGVIFMILNEVINKKNEN